MRKLMLALVMMLTGAFAFAAGTPASAATAAPAVSGLSEVVKTTGSAENVHYRRYRHRHWHHRPYWGRGFCWRHPYHWRCRPHHHRRHYYRRYW